MTVLHSGTSKKYSNNFEKAFGKTKRSPQAKSSGGKSAGKKSGKAKRKG